MKVDKYELPTINETRQTMQFLSKILYKTWKMELAKNLRELKFNGNIYTNYTRNSHPILHRLPDEYVKSALTKIQDELDELSYEYTFKFENLVHEKTWVLHYEIDIPEHSIDTSIDFYSIPDANIDSFFEKMSPQKFETKDNDIQEDDTFFMFEK